MAEKDTITTKFKVDISDLKKGITEANNQIKLANSEFKKASAGMDDWAKSSEGIKAKLDQLKSVLDAQTKKLESYRQQLATAQKYEKEAATNVKALKEALEKAKSEFGENSDEVKKLEKELSAAEKAELAMKNQVNALTVTCNNQEAAVKDTAAQMNNLEGELKDVEEAERLAAQNGKSLEENLEDVKNKAKNAGDGFTVMKGALASLVADGIRTAISALKDFVSETIEVGKNFDASMSQVAAVSGATGSELQALRDKAKEMGANTKFSASEAADAFNYMAMAGWKTEDMLDGIDGVLALAAASNTDLATTSDIVTDALTAMGYSAGDAGRLADVMAAASSNANTNVEMMGGTFKYVAPVVGALGYNMEDTAVAIGLMANSGIKAEQAGTSLRSILTRLAAPPKECAEAMDVLGLSITNADGTMKPLNQVIAEMQTAFNGLGEAEQAEMAKKIAGTEAMSGLLAIVNAAPADVDKLTEAVYGSSLTIDSFNQAASDAGIPIDNMRKAFEEAGVSNEQFDSILKLSGNDATLFAEMLGEAVDAGYNADDILAKLGITTGDLQTAMNNSTGAAENMAAVMQDNLSGDLTELGSKLEGVQIAIYEKFEPAMRKGVDILSKMLDGLNFIIEHSTGFITAITAMGTAVGTFLVIMNWSSIMSSAVTALNAVKTAMTGLFAVMAANPVALIVAAIAGLVVAFVTLWNKSEEFRNFWIGLWEGIKSACEPVIKAIGKAFTALWDDIKAVWEAVKPYFEALWKGIKDSLLPVIDSMKNAFEEAWKLIKVIWDLVEPYFTALWESIKSTFSAVSEVLSGFFNAAWEAIKFIWDLAVPYFELVWNNIKVVFSVVKDVLLGFFETAWVAIKAVWDTVTGYFQAVWDTIAAIFSVVRNVLTGNWQDAWDGIKGIVDTWKNYFSGVWDNIKQVFSSVGSFFKNSFQSAWDGVKKVFSNWGSFFSGLWDKLKNTFSGMGTKIGTAIGGAVKTAINGVISKIESTINSGINLINGAIGVINKLPGVNVSKVSKLSLPRLAKGGVLDRGARAVIAGEAGAEAVVPLERNKYWIGKVADEMMKQLRTTSNAAISNLTNNNTNNFTQIINAPKQPSRIELYRQTKNLLELKGAY